MVRMIPKLATVPLRHSGTGCLHPPSPTEGMAEFLGFLVVQRSKLPDTPELATVPDDIGANVDGPGLTLSAPDHSTVSRRAVTLPVIQPAQVPHGPLHVLIDGPGLQVYGAGQWLEAKHGAESRRTWRKLHLAVDAASGMIVAQTLMDQDVDDPSQVGSLLDQIDDPIGKVTADGAYDGTPTYQTIAQHGDGIEVVIPPRATAVPGGTECQLDDRNGRGGKSHDDRRVDAGGQRGANRVGGGGDLGECEVDADIRLEVNPRHGDALQRLALRVADAIDVITESERGIGGDAFVHFRRVHASAYPYDRDDREIDLGQDVLRPDNVTADAGE